MKLSLGKAIKIIREAKGMSLGSIASESQLSVPYLSLVENDKRKPSLDVIERLAHTLGIPVEPLILIGSKQNIALHSTNDSINRFINLLNKFDDLEKELKGAIEKT